MKQVQSFKSESGKVHETEHAAWVDDLDHWLKINGVENIGQRNQVATAVMADLYNGNHLTTIIAGMKRTAPDLVTPKPGAKVYSADDIPARFIGTGSD